MSSSRLELAYAYLLVFGLAVWLNALWLLVMLIPAIGIIAGVAIPREERFLEGNFGEQYSSYKASVRRWLHGGSRF